GPEHVFRRTRTLDHDHLGADLDLAVQVDDVLIAHADTAGRHRLPDGPGLVRAVNAIEARAEIHSARAERVFRPAFHVARQVGTALEHLRRRRPIRPLAHAAHVVDAGPGEARPADANAVTDRPAVLLHQIEQPLVRVDHDGARLFSAIVVDDLL